AEQYRTGLEVIDLTHPTNVELFRQWDQKELAYIQELRFIRISSDTPDSFVISRPGKHPFLITEVAEKREQEVETMDLDDVPLLVEAPSRFASTMMTMDGPPS
ncbi:hypothetical protein EUX98_g9726, partial [Antrodiella citrinella]